MENEKIKKLIRNCFIGMATNGKFNDNSWIPTLYSIIYVLENSSMITKEQRLDCVIEFFLNYNMGVSTPYTKDEIITKLAPIILDNKHTINLKEAFFYIDHSLDLI